MRKIYFIRHAHPDIPYGERWCVGKRTDKPLNAFGRMQAYLLGEHFKNIELSGCYSSYLKRACETASFIRDDYITFGGIEEKDMGLWDGLPFSEIMEQFPETYKARENDRTVLPEGAETLDEARLRFSQGTDIIKFLTFGDIAIVSHGGIMTDFFHNDKLPYAGYFITDENLNIIEDNLKAEVEMTPDIAYGLRDAAGMLDKIKIHCDAVAKEALYIAEQLRSKGIELDMNLIECSAILHDIARLEPDHEQTGAKYIEALGYHDVAEVIRQHAEMDSDDINEAAIVSLADKVTKEDRHITIKERFDMVRDKCREFGIEDILDRRYYQSLRVRDKINEICGKEVII